MKLGGRLDMRFSTAFESASILFVELCGFSAIGARLSPEDLINLLNAVRRPAPTPALFVKTRGHGAYVMTGGATEQQAARSPSPPPLPPCTPACRPACTQVFTRFDKLVEDAEVYKVSERLKRLAWPPSAGGTPNGGFLPNMR